MYVLRTINSEEKDPETFGLQEVQVQKNSHSQLEIIVVQWTASKQVGKHVDSAKVQVTRGGCGDAAPFLRRKGGESRKALPPGAERRAHPPH